MPAKRYKVSLLPQERDDLDRLVSTGKASAGQPGPEFTPECLHVAEVVHTSRPQHGRFQVGYLIRWSPCAGRVVGCIRSPVE